MLRFVAVPKKDSTVTQRDEKEVEMTAANKKWYDYTVDTVT